MSAGSLADHVTLAAIVVFGCAPTPSGRAMVFEGGLRLGMMAAMAGAAGPPLGCEQQHLAALERRGGFSEIGAADEGDADLIHGSAGRSSYVRSFVRSFAVLEMGQ